MKIITIIFCIAYVAVTICYLFSETSENFPRRVINKVILATMFLCYGFSAYALHYEVKSWHILFMIALVFSWLGDVVLLYDFTIGGILFIIGNLTFFAYSILLTVDMNIAFLKMCWIIPVFIVLWGAMFIVSGKKKLDFGKQRPALLAYLFSVTLHGTMGLGLAVNAPDVKTLVFGLGLVLFMISDYFLMTHKFGYPKSKTLLRCNSSTYFIGLMLIVISMSF